MTLSSQANQTKCQRGHQKDRHNKNHNDELFQIKVKQEETLEHVSRE